MRTQFLYIYWKLEEVALSRERMWGWEWAFTHHLSENITRTPVNVGKTTENRSYKKLSDSNVRGRILE